MEILGIDIGGTGIKGAIIDTNSGEMKTDRLRIPTPQPATPKAMMQTVAKLCKEFNWSGYIGAGFPAAIKHNIVKTASNIDKSWIGRNAAEEIQQVTGCQATVVNDVDAAGYAEVNFGAGKNVDGTVIVAAFGTGIGTAIFTEGMLLPNTELGHLKLKGMIAERYTSNAAREREDLDWDAFGKRVNKYLKRLEFLFWPDLIVIGGGVSKKYDLYSHKFNLETAIKPAKLKNQAGIIGAAMAAKHDFLEKKYASFE